MKLLALLLTSAILILVSCATPDETSISDPEEQVSPERKDSAEAELAGKEDPQNIPCPAMYECGRHSDCAGRCEPGDPGTCSGGCCVCR